MKGKCGQDKGHEDALTKRTQEMQDEIMHLRKMLRERDFDNNRLEGELMQLQKMFRDRGFENVQLRNRLRENDDDTSDTAGEGDRNGGKIQEAMPLHAQQQQQQQSLTSRRATSVEETALGGRNERRDEEQQMRMQNTQDDEDAWSTETLAGDRDYSTRPGP